MKNIIIIEPAHGENVHFPFNAGLLNIIGRAYASAQITFVGDSVQNKKIASALPSSISSRCVFKNWPVYEDFDTTPFNVLSRLKRLIQTVGLKIFTADLIVLSSATGTMLAVLNAILRPKKQTLQIFLHGNLNGLNGWRSKNPIRKRFDLNAGLQRSAALNAQLVVLEEHVHESAVASFPWLKGNIKYFPHPQIDEEAISHLKKLDYPIKIGLAGISSPDKGFSEFCKLAELLKERHPQKYEFHVIGKRHKSNVVADFKNLDQIPADRQLEREEYLQRIDKMHYLFFWPVGEYYQNASSGVFYDGLNRKIPFLTNFSVKSFRTGITDMGVVAGTIAELHGKILEVSDTQYDSYISRIAHFREHLSIDCLAPRYRELVDDFAAPLSHEVAGIDNIAIPIPISSEKP